MKRIIPSVLLCLGVACGNDATITLPPLPPSPLQPTGGLNLAPQLEFDPATVSARRSTDPAFEWEVAFEATLRDVARRGIRIDRVVLTVNESSGVELFRGEIQELVSGFVPTIPVGGSATWAFREVRYSRSGGGGDVSGNLRVEMETGVGDFRTMNFDFAIR